eukprot:GHUV01040757.1.p1 GENE.GHUV01040757.1~~GHUV01040757.1.p1  ORF type:complete len:122 (-),score=21.44 GHUV01040757.1:108-473(-)
MPYRRATPFLDIVLLQVHELVAQGSIAGLLLLSGNWLAGACHAVLLAYLLQLYTSRKLHVDTTDAFRQLPQQKKQRFILLGAHLLLFIVVVYRCVLQPLQLGHCLVLTVPSRLLPSAVAMV